MAIRIYQYPRCGTCRKAIKWLSDRDIPFEKIDIVEAPPSKEELRDLWERSGVPINKMFNTSGQAYRAGNFKERLKEMSAEEALDALAADGKLIKRPLVDNGEAVLVGFKDNAYVSVLGKRS